ncbi:cytochrome P450 [Crossiella sp. SN42]|uniref:cytochrome P450 n=1 Tax=Crossiella sp. SN42 TaxID=2944808 RepID=UPI00207C21CE|nr:cytochrome P450 [Crossiella sp. SN42]MCO1577906.1 cytochrome P450 [Crossiella sp. SN42]
MSGAGDVGGGGGGAASWKGGTIGSALWLLATHPEAWQALRADPTLARPVVEEMLRLETPPRFMARAATRDVDFHGVPLAQGDRVLAMMASANRDEHHYAAADTFDIHRNPTDHLAFGYGIHGCGGQGLARMEVTASLTALAEQVERIELSGEPARLLNNTMHGFEHLPVTFVPAA